LLVVGRALGADVPSPKDRRGRRPLGVLVHFTPLGLRRRVIYRLRPWAVERKVDADEPGALTRLDHFLQRNPRYHFALNNCEHVVSFVETGEAQSPQVQGPLVAAVLVALFALLSLSTI